MDEKKRKEKKKIHTLLYLDQWMDGCGVDSMICNKGQVDCVCGDMKRGEWRESVGKIDTFHVNYVCLLTLLACMHETLGL